MSDQPSESVAPNKKARRWVPATVVLTWTLLASLLLTFAWNMWPLLDGDAKVFVPPILGYAKEGRLVNTVWPLARHYDRTGEGRLVYHGFLYELVVGTLAPAPSYRWIVFTMAVMDALSLALWAAIFYRLAARITHPMSWWHLAFLSLSLAGLATALLGLRGRPESFVIFVLGVAVNLLLSLPGRWHGAIGGLTIGVVATAHPVAAFLTGSLWSVYISCLYGTRKWIRTMLVSALFAILAMAAILCWYPYRFDEWVKCCMGHYDEAIIKGWWKADAISYWFIASRPPLFGVICLLALAASVLLCRSYSRQIATRFGFWLSAILFAAASYYFAMYVPARLYNLQAFVPLAYGLIYAGLISSYSGKKEEYWRLTGAMLAGLVLVASALGLARATVVFAHYMHHGMPYVIAQDRIEQIRRRHLERITVSMGLFTLLEDCRGVSFNDFKEFDPAVLGNVLILQQAHRTTQIPPAIPGFELVEDHFLRAMPSLFGVKCGNSPLGYDYAVFFRTNGPDFRRKLNTEL